MRDAPATESIAIDRVLIVQVLHVRVFWGIGIGTVKTLPLTSYRRNRVPGAHVPVDRSLSVTESLASTPVGSAS